MRVIAFILVFTLYGCTSEERVIIGLGAIEVQDLAPTVFDKENIWFKKHEDGRFEFKKVDVPRVLLVVGEVAESIRPVGQSATYGPEMEAIMLRQLKTTSIPYQVRRFDGRKRVVWDPRHRDQIYALEKQAKEELRSILVD